MGDRPSLFVPLMAGILLLLVVLSLFVFVIPTVQDRMSRMTLWEKWKWERDVRILIRQYQRMNAQQKSDFENGVRVCVDP